MEKYHYIYKLIYEETGQYYIGVRTSNVKPEFDYYKGSMYTWKIDRSILKKEILNLYSTREEAELAEDSLILQHITNELNMNFNGRYLSKAMKRYCKQKRKKYI